MYFTSANPDTLVSGILHFFYMISVATNIVNKVAVVDVKDTTFNVTFEAVSEATQGYIVEIYSNSVLIQNITSASNNVLVSNVNPYSQEYFVRVAFVTAFATSEYSAQVSSRKYLYYIKELEWTW